MQKAFLFARAAGSPEELADWFGASYPALLRANGLQPSRYVLNICDVAPQFRLAPFIARDRAVRQHYDLAAELWFEPQAGGAGLADVLALHAPELAQRCDRLHAWEVTERPCFAPEDGTAGDIKFIALGCWQNHLSQDEGRRYWTEHACLVPRIHIGVNAYVQNWVASSSGTNLPQVDGIAELHFPSVETLEQDFYNSAEGQEEIRQDVIRFTKSAITLCARTRLVEGGAR
jgi:hypothetical protein